MGADGSRWMLVRVILPDVTLLSVWTLPATGGLLCSAARLTDDGRIAVMSLIAWGLMTN